MKKNVCFFCGKPKEQFTKNQIKIYYENEPEDYIEFCCNRHYGAWNNQEIKKVRKLALTVLGKEKFKKWLYTKNKKLNNKTPKEYLQDIRRRKKLLNILENYE